MKIGLYADPHFSQSSSIIVGRKGSFAGRLDNLIQSFTWMNELFRNEGCEEVVCLGDLTDKPVLTSEEITALSRCELNSHRFVLGNHCRSDKNGKINSLSLFDKVYSEPSVWEVEGRKFLILPYNSDLYKFGPDEHYDVIFSHNDIKDYDLGNGYLSQSGYEVSEILNHCTLFINGHLHNGSWIIKDRILNLGVLSGINFANCNSSWNPSVAILDTADLSLKFVENPYAYKFKKLEITKLPKLKEYLSGLQGDNYVIQIKTLANISDSVRKLLDQDSKVVASRVLLVNDSKAVINQSLNKVRKSLSEDTRTVYTKLIDFLGTSDKISGDLDTMLSVIKHIATEG